MSIILRSRTKMYHENISFTNDTIRCHAWAHSNDVVMMRGHQSCLDYGSTTSYLGYFTHVFKW